MVSSFFLPSKSTDDSGDCGECTDIHWAASGSVLRLPG